MAWCERQGVDFVLGLARNARLQKRIDKALRKSRRRCAATGQASRRFRELRYRTLKSWSRRRRVVAKAEWLAGARGGNPRFVVTSLDRQTIAKQALYEELYCARGDMENRIKEQQLWLFADRTSAATMRANQLRLYFSAFAGILMTILRRAGLKGTALAAARFDTIRSRLQARWAYQGIGAQGADRVLVGISAAASVCTGAYRTACRPRVGCPGARRTRIAPPAATAKLTAEGPRSGEVGPNAPALSARDHQVTRAGGSTWHKRTPPPPKGLLFAPRRTTAPSLQGQNRLRDRLGERSGLSLITASTSATASWSQ